MNSTRQFRRAGPIAALLAVAVWGCTDSPTQPRDGAIPIKPSFAAGGSIGVNLDQCANKPRTAVCTWQNGDLNGNNSVYAEGLVVPFRLSVDGLTVGTQYQIRINYDFTAGGHKAYDFLASHDATETVNICASGGGGVPQACPLAAVTPAAVTWTENNFPSTLPGAPNTNSVLGAIAFSGLTSTQRQLRLYKGSIDNIGPVTHTTSNGTVITDYSQLSGNSDGDILVTFTPTSSSVLFTWGGHLAQSPYWESPNNPNGAGQVSGAPWHMRTQQLQTANGTSAGNKNQDRSIQPSAIVEPPAITVTKTADAATVNAGEQIGYTITVTNTGQGGALAFALTDPLPGGAGINWSIPVGGVTGNSGIGCAISGSAPNQVLNCPASGTATFPAGATLSVHVISQTTSASCAVYNNTATAAFTGGPSSAGPVSITVNCPDVTVAKTAANASINAGDVASFTITVTNLGPGTAKSVTLNDPLPGGLSWAISGGTGAGSCVNPIVGNTLSCNFGDMIAGASFTVTVSATTAAANCGTLPNLATVAATNEPASAQGNNTANASIVVNCGDVHINKTADAVQVNAGDQIGFTITASNTGAGDATGFVLTDVLPTGGGLSWTIQSQSGPVTCAISGNTLRCPPSGTATLPAGTTLTVHVISPTSAANCGTVPNTASFVTGNDGSGNAGANITVLCPDVTVLKTAAASPINAGDVASFTITVTNSGAGLAKNVTLNDPLPGGLSWAISGGTGAGSCVNPIAGNTLSCNFGDMVAGASLTVTVSATTAAANCGTLPNLATVAATNEANTGNNTSQASIVVLCPDVTVQKTAANTPISAGDVAQFTMTVTNLGPGVAKAVTLSDPLPAGLSWAETPDLGNCSISSGTLNCTIGDMAPQGTFSVTVSATTGAANCGTLPNLVTVAATNEAPEQTANNSANANIVVNCGVIDITKTPDAASVSAGTNIGFLLTVSNTGQGNATGVVLTDVLPTNAGLNWSVDGGTAAGTCSIASGTLTCNLGTVIPGGSATVHLTSPTTDASCGTVNNTGNVTTGNDGTDQAGASVNVLCPSLSIVKTPNAGSVNPGGTATFTITVSNAGPGEAFNVQILDTLPSVAPNHWTDDQGPCSVTSIAVPVAPTPRDSLFCAVGTLASGGSFTVHVSAVIPLGFNVNPPSPGSAADAIEIDGNLVDSPAGGPKDWQTLGIVCPPNANPTGCAVDITPVANDNAFGEGTKEDDITPTVVTGSIPPNKSDLIRFYTAKERFGTNDFLYLAWIRINSPQGTTNMDFELNKLAPPAGGGPPARSDGDILIKYDLSQGGTTPTLGFHKWVASGPKSLCEAANSTPCWGKVQALSAAQGVTGQTNGVAVSDPIVNLTLDPFTFGEASIDLQTSGIFPAGQCVSFGSAYLKSRSSDSFTSAIKDFISPIPINLTNCSPVPLPNTAYARASNFQGNAWISDGGLITVQVAQSTSSLVAPSRQQLAIGDTAGGVTGLLASAGDKAIWIPTRRGPRVV